MINSSEATASEYEFEVGAAVRTTCGNVRGKIRQRITSANGVCLYILKDQRGRDRSLRGEGLVAA